MDGQKDGQTNRGTDADGRTEKRTDGRVQHVMRLPVPREGCTLYHVPTQSEQR